MNLNICKGMLIHAFAVILVLACSTLVGAQDETNAPPIRCHVETTAFDPQSPAHPIGAFQPGSLLRLTGPATAEGLQPVVFTDDQGHEIRALCRVADLTPADSPAPADASASGESAPPSDPSLPPPPPSDSNLPPLFNDILQFRPELWEMPASQFALTHGRFGFRWVSATDTSTSRSAQPLKFLGKQTFETTVQFGGDRLKEATLLIFGRGDAKQNLGEMEFRQLLKELEESLNQWSGVKGLDAWVERNTADLKRKSWLRFPLRVDLESSFTANAKEMGATKSTGFRAEFVRLIVTAYDGRQRGADLVKPNFQEAPKILTAKRATIKERVKRDSGGDVYLDGIPMVDQGQKGYCVCATVERALKYYGLDVDQNEMAKIANAAPESGTSPDAMYKVLRRLGAQFNLTVRDLTHPLSFNEFFREVDQYNQLARQGKKPPLDCPRSGTIPVYDIYAAMDPTIFRQVKLKHSNDRSKFWSDITSQVDDGAPLLWGVTLGIVQETPALPQRRGAHMRLIFGYNAKTQEVIYSDSWGAGHEMKKMALDDAFVILTGLYSVAPSS